VKVAYERTLTDFKALRNDERSFDAGALRNDLKRMKSKDVVLVWGWLGELEWAMGREKMGKIRVKVMVDVDQ